MGKKILKLSLKIFIFIFMITTLIIFFMLYVNYKININNIKKSQIVEVKAHHILVEKIIESLTSDVLYISNQPSVRNLKNKDQISENFLQYAESKKIFDQLRFIDTDGNEIIRVNWNYGKPKIVEKFNLQNKKERYYFTDTIKLDKNQVFISPLDLNIENGKIEKPLKPMIRIGTPVFDYNNKKIGVIILNYLASNLLKEIKDDIRIDYGNLQFLNQDGYWLYSENKNEEWGFMFLEKKDKKFLNKYSKENWDKILFKDYGQFETKFGIFTFDTIYPLNIHHKSSSGSEEVFKKNDKNLDWTEYKWKIVLFISKFEEKEQLKKLKIYYIIPWFLFIIFSIGISYIIAKNIILKKKALTQVIESQNMNTISQLAAGVAHEINSPLGFVNSNFQVLQDYFTIISEYISILKENKEKIDDFEKNNETEFILEDLRELFSETKLGIKRVSEIIRNLRIFSNIDVEKTLSNYNINDAIINVIKLFKIQEKTELKFHSDGVFQCKSSLINLAFYNVLKNSLEALSKVEKNNFPLIIIKTYDKNDKIFIEITDFGCGISKENLKKVFEPFFTTKDIGEGPGLGLYIIYDIIVHKYKGNISITSVLKEKTTVKIELPKYSQKKQELL